MNTVTLNMTINDVARDTNPAQIFSSERIPNQYDHNMDCLWVRFWWGNKLITTGPRRHVISLKVESADVFDASSLKTFAAKDNVTFIVKNHKKLEPLPKEIEDLVEVSFYPHGIESNLKDATEVTYVVIHAWNLDNYKKYLGAALKC